MSREAPQVRLDLILRLPRELRDSIYRYAIEGINDAHPIALKYSQIHDAVRPILMKYPSIYSEALEVFYSVNTFILTLPLDAKLIAQAWDFHPLAKACLRHLVIECDESRNPRCSFDTYEQSRLAAHWRRRWDRLFDIPTLQSLEIRLQKSHEDNLCTLDFGPVVYHLRALRPSIKISLSVSFDTVLEKAWNDPRWYDPRTRGNALGVFPGGNIVAGVPPEPEDAYRPMGFIDASHLIEPPGEEQRSYVAQYLPEHKMPPPRPIGQGLLDHTPEGRRVLATHYISREPDLLRVEMQEHYEVYLKYKKERRERAAGQ
jgi:hypothetical protein